MSKFVLTILVLFGIEILGMIALGSAIGFLNTVFTLIISCSLGIVLARARFLKNASNGLNVILYGITLTLFLIPGIISDILAYILMIPNINLLLLPLLIKFIQKRGFVFSNMSSFGNFDPKDFENKNEEEQTVKQSKFKVKTFDRASFRKRVKKDVFIDTTYEVTDEKKHEDEDIKKNN